MERIKVSYCGSNFECGSCIEGEACAVAKCVKSRGIRFCGECGEIGCESSRRSTGDTTTASTTVRR